MHILIVPSEEFIPTESHLAGIFQLHQARALIAAGHKVGVLSVKQVYSGPMLLKGILRQMLGLNGSKKLPAATSWHLLKLLIKKMFSVSEFVREEEVESIPVTRIEGFYYLWPSLLFDHYGWIIAGRTAYAAYSKVHGRPDIIHAHNALYGGMLARSLNSQHGIPYMVTEHSSHLARQLVPKVLVKQAARCYSKASTLGVVSPSLGEKLAVVVGNTAHNALWIPNVVDPACADCQAKRAPQSPFRFLAIGSLIPIKDHVTLLKGFALFSEQLGGAILSIIGDGDEVKSLQENIEILGLTGHVRLLGLLPREKVFEEIDKAHCIVLSSLLETFGVCLIEGLARGRPVIATRCGGPECFVNDQNGKLINVGDYKELGMAMIWMRNNIEKFDPKDLQRDTLQKFGSTALTRKLELIYQAAIKDVANN